MACARCGHHQEHHEGRRGFCLVIRCICPEYVAPEYWQRTAEAPAAPVRLRDAEAHVPFRFRLGDHVRLPDSGYRGVVVDGWAHAEPTAPLGYRIVYELQGADGQRIRTDADRLLPDA